MRYYSIIIRNAQTNELITAKSLAGAFQDATYTSFVNNQTLPGALDVEFDIPVAPFATPMGNAQITIWGPAVAEISQSNDLNGAKIQVFGGMQKGLPLANPKQAGLLVQGYIFQAFGNWIDTDQNLVLVIIPTAPSAALPNIVLDWPKGNTLAEVLPVTLSNAFPDMKTEINISQNIVPPNDITAIFGSLTELAQFLKGRSAEIVGGTYTGIDIQLTQNTFKVYDGTSQSNPKQIEFQDLIGQPTWIDPSTVQSKFVMRADLAVGDFIKFPTTPVVSNAASNSPLVNAKLTFQGSFMIQRIRHVGVYRQASADAWVTVVDASTLPVASTAAA
jgi:hypothetical protein